jgi:hypothetical protein
MSPTLSVNGRHDPLASPFPPVSGPAPAAPDTPVSTGANGHDARGRFAKGNRGGPGNPFARQTAALRRALTAAVTEADMQAVAGQLVTQAKLGHLAAIKLLLAYVLGKPAEPVNPDTLDVQEWQLYQQTPVTSEALSTVLESMHADLACTIARAALPEVAQAQARHLAGQLDPEPPAPPPTPPATPTVTAREQASTEPAPTAAACAAPEPAADADRPQTGGTVPPERPFGGTAAADRPQTGETARDRWVKLAALLGREPRAPDGTPAMFEVRGPSANGENGQQASRSRPAPG